MGGHAFPGRTALYELPGSGHFVVDGESGIYRHAKRFAEENGPSLFRVREQDFETTSLCKGNVALLDEGRSQLFLSTDWAGIFPLYYTLLDGGILFSSLCKPLATVTCSPPDYVGLVEYMLCEYFIGDRTPFRNIRRLLPGQVLVYSPRDGSASFRETSRYWSGTVGARAEKLDIKEVSHTFREACFRCFDREEVQGLMFSAGWDSRTLLAGLLHVVSPGGVTCLTHGDLRSRELGLTGAICRSVGVTHVRLPIEDHLTDLEELKAIFQRCETTSYPYWYRAARRLAAEGVTCVSAGVLGEVFGGHYGVGSAESAWGKVKYLASSLVLPTAIDGSSYGVDLGKVVGAIKRGFDRRPWYIREDFWRAAGNLSEVIEDDIDADLRRYERRGVASADQVFEAYRTEHRGAQEICKQALTSRAVMDIAIPFGDRDLMMLASQVPMRTKIHNRLNRSLLKASAPQLLRHPTAAVLLPASFPIIAQEASRFVRRAMDAVSSNVSFRRQGTAQPRHADWRNFPCLRDGVAMNHLLDDVRLELLDKTAIRKCIADVVNFRTRVTPESLQWTS
jgi:asparagine synthetase B (glutamine-hydrolysing)